MFSLNLKIPPPIVLAVAALAMWLLSVFFPAETGPQFRIFAVPMLLCISLFFAISGILSFKKAATTINPLTPNKASSLVIVGIYQYTRNPMYVGLLFVLIAWAVFLWSLHSVVLLIAFVLYITAFQIKPEEEALIALFGEEYSAYKNTVRRWL